MPEITSISVFSRSRDLFKELKDDEFYNEDLLRVFALDGGDGQDVGNDDTEQLVADGGTHIDSSTQVKVEGNLQPSLRPNVVDTGWDQ